MSYKIITPGTIMSPTDFSIFFYLYLDPDSPNNGWHKLTLVIYANFSRTYLGTGGDVSHMDKEEYRVIS